VATYPPYYLALVRDQQAQLTKLVNAAGVGPVKRLYQQMLRDLEKKLKASASGTFDFVQLHGMMAQVRLGLAQAQREIGSAVSEGAARVGIQAARNSLDNAARMEKHFKGAVVSLPVMEIGRLRGLVEGQTPSVMRVHDRTMRRYGMRLTGRIETELAASLTAAESQTQAVDRVMRVAGNEWWQAERIVRTEMSFASNAVARAANDEMADELDGDMWSQWSEHVTDDGVPLDDRVGVDSEALHGQVAPPGGMFVQPPSSRRGALVSGSLVGQSWACPPNRPNDRSVLTPWRASWGIPGWVWDGRRIPVTEAYAERANVRARRAAPVRPELPSE
jgi:hypothetical protein